MPAVKRFAKTTPGPDVGKSPAALIDQRIAELPDWQGELLAQLRALIRDADPKNGSGTILSGPITASFAPGKPARRR